MFKKDENCSTGCTMTAPTSAQMLLSPMCGCQISADGSMFSFLHLDSKNETSDCGHNSGSWDAQFKFLISAQLIGLLVRQRNHAHVSQNDVRCLRRSRLKRGPTTLSNRTKTEHREFTLARMRQRKFQHLSPHARVGRGTRTCPHEKFRD